MEDLQSLRHTRWMCKFHIVWIPKCRKKKLYGQLRQDLGNVFRELALQKECQIEEGHLLRDHVHILISVPPKYAVSQVIGFIKGKSAIHIARGPLALASATLRVSISGQEVNFVSTVGKDEKAVCKYIQEQAEADRRLDQLNLFDE